MKIYTLTIVYNDEKEEIEYLTEEIQGDGSEVLREQGVVEMEGYFDEEDLELISGCYIVGEA
jgi:hypothetical protein|tara:strand:+ start:52 stop:237 length:186 start_codon:yes stop_codon:yes gene_type:complete